MKRRSSYKNVTGGGMWYVFTIVLFFVGLVSSCNQTSMVSSVSVRQVRPDATAPPTPLVLEERFISAHVLKAKPAVKEYYVGPDDVLFVDLADEDATGKGSRSSGQQQGRSTISSEGQINLPLVGSVKVNGKTVEQVRQLLIARYKKYIKDPQVVVEVLEKKSKPIYLLGEFNKPKKIFMTRATSVIQAISEGGGIGANADLRHARLIRRNKVVAVDIYAILKEGQLDQNVWLEANDVIYVPDDKDQRVYVLGEVTEPGSVQMVHGKLTLNQAITGAGGLNRINLEIGNVRIIRTLTTTRGALITIDIKKIRDGSAMAFNLQAGDVIYLPKSKMGSWNDIMRAITPTIDNVFSISNTIRGSVINEYDR